MSRLDHYHRSWRIIATTPVHYACERMRRLLAAAINDTVRAWRSGAGRVFGDRFYLLDYSRDLFQHLKVRRAMYIIVYMIAVFVFEIFCRSACEICTVSKFLRLRSCAFGAVGDILVLADSISDCAALWTADTDDSRCGMRRPKSKRS